MNFHLSDDQLALKDSLERFLADTMEQGAARAPFEGGPGFDRAFWDALMAMGVGGIALDPDYDGLGLDLFDLALVAELLGYAGAPGPFLGHALAGLAIQAAGDAAQKALWLPRLASGEAIGSVALAEQGSSWFPEEWTADVADGRLTSVKTSVLCPEAADVFVVGLADGQLAIVARDEATMTIEAIDGADRGRGLATVRFDAAAAQPLGMKPGTGEALFDALCVLVAADAFGGARCCLEMTTDYVKARRQFGGSIARFQGIKHRLANLATEVEPARGLVWYAAVAVGAGQAGAGRAASLAKAHLADRFQAASRTAVELHGGIGVTWEYDLQIWVKRALFDYAYAGVPSRHRRRAALLEET